MIEKYEFCELGTATYAVLRDGQYRESDRVEVIGDTIRHTGGMCDQNSKS